ncbi:MAG: RluA family pseudouridine synthase [Candidatus Moranbacteria bacterium]|nr:RluA family pseudouridine synthase [Candidatus Moranbacteria bacterium]
MTAEPFTLEIPRHLNDQRVDRALATLLAEKLPEKKLLSRAFLARCVKNGLVLLNGAAVLPRALVATHDLLTVTPTIFAEAAPLQPSTEPIIISVLYEDDQLLVLDKGAGVQMHQGGAHAGTTVAQWILAHYPLLATIGGDPNRPGIVHRLDRETSGVLLVAKTNKSFAALKKAFQEREIEKTYVALVYGHMSELTGEIDTALIRQAGALKRRAVDLEQYQGVLPGNVRTALTRYRVFMRYQDHDLLVLTPKTGRTHQIRVHLSSIGHPVVGDKLYVFKNIKRRKLLFPKRHLLHATKLSFSLFGQPYQFHAPLPQDFKRVLRDIDETKDTSYDDEALESLL